MKSELTFKHTERTNGSSSPTSLRLNAYSDLLIVGQALCKYTKSPKSRLDQTATLSTLSSVYGAIKKRFDRVFEGGTAARQEGIYSDEVLDRARNSDKIEGIGLSIIRELIAMLKRENTAFLEIEIAQGGGTDLLRYYQTVVEELAQEGAIIAWGTYSNGIRLTLSDELLLF